MPTLPVSGLAVTLRQPTGAEDLLLLEAPAPDAALALALIARLACPASPEPVAWETLTMTDLDALVLLIRRAAFGDLVRADVRCPATGCAARIDVDFRVGEYLAFHRPRPARGVAPAAEPGWFRLPDAATEFRLPTGADLVAIAGQPDPERALRRRCLRPPDAPARQRRRAERAMAALAPSLSRPLQGRCPDCGAAFETFFDVQQFCLRELGDQARFVHDDVHLLARHYGWSEADILALPRARRAEYAERLRAEGRGG